MLNKNYNAKVVNALEGKGVNVRDYLANNTTAVIASGAKQSGNLFPLPLGERDRERGWFL